MAGTRLHGVYLSAVLSLAFVGGLAARPGAQSKGALRFNVKDYVGISQVRLNDTIKTAAAIYAAAGVEVGWTYRCFLPGSGPVQAARESSVDAAMDLMASCSSCGKRRISITVVGLKAQMNAWIHGTTASPPAQPMTFTASASG